MSDCTSTTSVSDLLAAKPRAAAGQAQVQQADRVSQWVEDSVACSGLAAGDDDGGAHTAPVVQLQLDLANGALAESKARARQLEQQARELRAELEAERGGAQAAKSSQGLLVERIQELEVQLRRSAEAEQTKAAQLARLESRAAVAEGSLRSAEQQVAQALAELQAQRAKELGDLEARHAREVAQLRDQHAAEVTDLKAGCEAKVAELEAAARAAEAAAARDAQRSKEAVAALDKERSKKEAVKELMRHSEELQAQVDRLQAALQEERRRANRAAQSAESSLAVEREHADAATAELQLKMQDLGREHEKALRTARAKLQRAETDLRGARQQAAQLGARVQELESLNAKKDLQLDAAAQEVAAMQRELQALRQGLSGREAAMLESARAQYAAALEECRADLRGAQQRLSEQALLVQRQGAALASVADILAAHACDGPAPQSDRSSGGAEARLPAVEPEKVVTFVEAVSSTMLDLQQQWELERAEAVQAAAEAAAVRGQLEALLQQEREEGRQLAGDAARLQDAEGRLAELEGVRSECEAAERSLEACRAELNTAVAKAAAAAEDCAKWRGTAQGLEVQLQQAAAGAEVSRAEAAELRAAAAAKDERLREMRSAMAAALDDKSSAASDLQRQLAQLQQAEQQLAECRAELARYHPAAAAAARAAQEALPKLQTLLQVLEAQDGPADRASILVAAAIQPGAAALGALCAPSADAATGLASLGSVVLQLCGALVHVGDVLQERGKIYRILSTVNAKLRTAGAQHVALLPAGAASTGGQAQQGAAPLVALLQQLTENVVGLIEGLAVEKECLTSEMLHVQQENHLLQGQIQTMQSALASLQGDSSLEQQLSEALASWAQAQAHAAALETDNTALAQRLEQAQAAVDAMRASSTQEWAGVRDDVAKLVQHAEQAQLDAEGAVERLRAECDDRVAKLQREVEAAVAGRAAAEEAAADAARQLDAAQQHLRQRSEAEGQAQESTHAALRTAQQSVSHLEAQVAQLQRRLVQRFKGRVGTAAAKKAAAASTRAALLRHRNERLARQRRELEEKVASLEGTIRQGRQQLKQLREQAGGAQSGMAEAQAKAAKLEALLRKVDERKAAIEVERRRAQEGAARLEAQLLELQSKLEAALQRERQAQADAEHTRGLLARREREAKELAGAVQQVEVAEGALRDSHATASRLLQECTSARHANQELTAQVKALTRQLEDAQQGHAAALQQVQDLQEAFDTALTELDIARSLLAGQRQQGAGEAASPAQGQQQQPAFLQQRIMAFPVALAAAAPAVQAAAPSGGHSQQEQQAASELIRRILGSSNSSKLAAQGTVCPGASAPEGPPPAGQAASRDPQGGLCSPITQLRTPATPLTSYPGNGASAPHMADDASSHRPTPEGSTCAAGDENWRPTSSAACPAQQAPHPCPALAPSRPDSAVSQAPPVDVEDVRSLVLAVESLQRQLQVKNDRIRELRGALQKQQASPPGAPAATSSGASAEAFVLQQKLEAAMQQLDSLRALCTNLEVQLSEAQQAKRELTQQLSTAACKLAAMAGGPAAAGGSAPQEQQQPWQPQCGGGSGSDVAPLQLQLAQFEQQLAALERQVEGGQVELATAQQRASELEVELAERDALMEALHAQLAAVGSSGSSNSGAGGDRSSAGTQTDDREGPQAAVAAAAAEVLRAASRPSSRAGPSRPGSAQASGALSSLDRIVGLWKSACEAKDMQIEELRDRMAEAQDALAAAEAGREALQQQVQDAAVAVRGLKQRLTDAQLGLTAAQAREGELSRQGAQLEGELQAAAAEAQSCRQALGEARERQQGTERRVGSLEQQLEIAQAQVREAEHAAQLERLSHGDADALRRQLAAARVELDMAREAAAAAQQRSQALSQQLQEQQSAAEAAAAGAAAEQTSQLGRQLEVAREAERRLLREAQDAGAALRAAQQEVGELQQALTVREAQLRQVLERLEAAEAQLADAGEALEAQSGALEDMQAVLEQARHDHADAAASCQQHAEAATALTTAQQQLALMQQRLEVAERQMEVLRAQLGAVEGDRVHIAAEKQRLQSQEARLADATQRYHAGLRTLGSALRQLQSADAEGGLDVLAVLGHYQGAAGQQGASEGAGAKQAQQPSVEELVDDILFFVHRRDCDISALLAQVSQLEAAVASKTREVSEQQGRLQQSLGSIARVKEQLHWCTEECAALKRQLHDKDSQIARLKAAAAAAGGGGGGLGAAGNSGGLLRASSGGLGGWTSLARKL